MTGASDQNDKFRMDLIGPFGLFAPSGARIDVRSRKGVALLALLAFSPNGLRTRAWLQAILWGSRAHVQAQSSLRRELSTLVAVLDAHGAGDLLVRDAQRVQLRTDCILLDTDRLALVPGDNAVRSAGDLLEGIDLRDCEGFEDWLRAQRTRISELQRYAVPDPVGEMRQPAAVLGGPLPETSQLISAAPPAIPPKPSIAVLPFAVADGSSLPTWLGESIAEDIGLTLGSFPSLFVVASSAAATLAHRRMLPTEIAQALGVRYLLSGSLRTGKVGVRTAAQLIDGQSGEQIWVHQFATPATDLADLGEQVSVAVAPQILSKIDLAERHRGLTAPMARDDSYALYWRANALFRRWERDSGLEAILLTDELVAINPGCALSASLAAYCNATAYAFRWTADPQASRRAAIQHYQNALRLGGSNVEVLGFAAGTLVAIGGDMDQADRLVSFALSLMPAYQPTLFWGGWVDISNGRAARARERFELSLRINPSSGVRSYALTGIGISLLFTGDAAAAVDILKHAAIELTDYPLTQAALAIAAALTGDKAIARAALASVDRLGGPDLVLQIFRNEEQRALAAAALAMAAR
jgi:TolB-like protein/tetratricopeptide (TPR) repeat protein